MGIGCAKDDFGGAREQCAPGFARCKIGPADAHTAEILSLKCVRRFRQFAQNLTTAGRLRRVN